MQFYLLLLCKTAYLIFDLAFMVNLIDLSSV